MKKRNWLPLLAAVTFTLIYVSCSKPSTTSYLGDWFSLGESKGAARSGAFSFTIGDIGYLGGGTDGTHRLSDFWQLDTKTNIWHQLASLDTVIVNGDSVVVAPRVTAVGFSVDGIGYVGTGYDGNNYLNDFYAYNPATKAWTRKANFIGGKRSQAIGFGINHKGYIGTGQTADLHAQNDFYSYDPTSDSWSIIDGVAGEKRYSAATFTIGTDVYILTGINPSIGGATAPFLNDVLVFHSADGTWGKKNVIYNYSTDSYDDDYTDIVRSNAVAFTLHGKGYLTLGFNGSNLLKTWEYDPAIDRWNRKTSFESSGRLDAVSFSINDEHAYIGTGRTGATFFDDFWEFLPNDTYVRSY